MLIYESDYSIFKYDEENSIFSHIFKPATEDLDAEKFKKEMLIYLEYFEKYKPKRALVNNQEMQFIIVPKLQNWHAQNIFPKCIELGVELAAIVISPDLFAHISMEQLMEEEKSGAVTVKYFEDVDEATKWLIS
ncbi:hypothetical protein Fleli_2946 [Bernardetia litoralis DSM 6794]|uniref:SpoIIAA-like protein n=1 Tax=Bernardetia litoralis (strain ATCC 23117 / DSM 6794 / NBRC 15988 / NCIMB 1366 / Fx l1 / Sio-4) TaxID=880071 RepID=I4AMV8_BERLS|nr:hypothetical protein [Bernardetia litoralis]AFM05293.1 hypothetical protein Fleli_2946 [Bernardetia litoralis DSM 6794]